VQQEGERHNFLNSHTIKRLHTLLISTTKKHVGYNLTYRYSRQNNKIRQYYPKFNVQFPTSDFSSHIRCPSFAASVHILRPLIYVSSSASPTPFCYGWPMAVPPQWIFSLHPGRSRNNFYKIPDTPYFQTRSHKCEKRQLISFVMSACVSVRPSVCPHGTTWLPLDGFSWKFNIWVCFENLSRKFKLH